MVRSKAARPDFHHIHSSNWEFAACIAGVMLRQAGMHQISHASARQTKSANLVSPLPAALSRICLGCHVCLPHEPGRAAVGEHRSITQCAAPHPALAFQIVHCLPGRCQRSAASQVPHWVHAAPMQLLQPWLHFATTLDSFSTMTVRQEAAAC